MTQIKWLFLYPIFLKIIKNEESIMPLFDDTSPYETPQVVKK